MATLSDLLSTKTLDDWKQSIVNAAESVALAVENWSEGGFTRTLLALFVRLYKSGGDVVKFIAAAGFLDYAEGDWLTLLAKEVFDVDRIEATKATAPLALRLTNTGGGFFEFEAGDVVVSNGLKTYRSASAGSLSGIGSTLDLDLEADEPGSASSTGAGTITTMVTTFTGVTCTNLVALVGLDEEKDPDLRVRCRASLAARAIGGIKKAYEFYAKSAAHLDGSPIGVTRVRVVPPTGDGTLTVYIASASGAIGSSDVARVQDIFDRTVTPIGFDATAVSATNLSVALASTIWLPSSLAMTEADAQKAVNDALVAYVDALPIGGVILTPPNGYVLWRGLLGVIENAIPGMLKAQLETEADILCAAGEAPVWAGIASNVTVHLVSTA